MGRGRGRQRKESFFSHCFLGQHKQVLSLATFCAPRFAEYSTYWFVRSFHMIPMSSIRRVTQVGPTGWTLVYKMTHRLLPRFQLIGFYVRHPKMTPPALRYVGG